MSYAIGAAGTGGHVYPGLAVGEALERAGVDRKDINFFGGRRLERRVYPQEGFPFVELDIRGWARHISARNLLLPLTITRAVRLVRRELHRRGVRVAIAMGSYVTVPLGLAARRLRVPFFVQEQNASPGIANRLMATQSEAAFVSFRDTPLRRAVWVGNPLRSELAEFSRQALHSQALDRYGLEENRCTVGVIGGSLGARALNDAAGRLVSGWDGPPLQLLHVCGPDHLAEVSMQAEAAPVPWHVIPFEEQMAFFYAACDVVVARGGGMVAEILATRTPSILVPGGFGSSGHQDANARAAEQAGASLVVQEAQIESLPRLLRRLCADAEARKSMAGAAARLAKPDAAQHIAAILMGRHG